MLLHRHHITAFLQTLLILFAFASCIGDDFADGTGSTSGLKEYDLYLQIHSVGNTAQTRTTHDETDGESAGNGDFVHGDENEHTVGTEGNYVIFFTKDGNYFSTEELEENHTHNPGHTPAIPNDPNYIEAQYKTTVSPNDNDEWPKYCLVVLNGKNIISSVGEGTKMDNILNTKWETTVPARIGRDGDLFTLTNSAYLENGKLCRAVELPEISFKTNKDKTEDDVLHVHVERMLAKFSFEDTKGDHIYTPIDEEILLFNGYDDNGKDPENPYDKGILKTVDIADHCRIEVTGWGINALENESYLFKNINKESNYFGDWNSPTYFRSYWSEDPHYYKNDYSTYPWQYRYAVERKYMPYYEGQPDDYKALINYSYTDFTEGVDFDRYVYVPENTYDAAEFRQQGYTLDDRMNVLAGTHLILCAELKVDKSYKDAGENTDLEDVTPSGEYLPTNLYRDRFGVYYKTARECLAELVREFNYQLKSQSTMRYRYYTWNITEQGDVEDGEELVAKTTGDYQLYNGDTPVTWDYIMGKTDELLSEATILSGDGKLMPWLENEISNWTIRSTTGESLEIYNGDYDFKKDEEYDKKGETVALEGYRNSHRIRSQAITYDIKSLLYEWLGAIDHFNDGKMYYFAPVWHNKAGNEQSWADQNALGDYGVVRNNWYKYTLKNITHLGTPVDQPGDPIVPNRVDRQDRLNFKVEILNWHKVGTSAPVLK